MPSKDRDNSVSTDDSSVGSDVQTGLAGGRENIERRDSIHGYSSDVPSTFNNDDKASFTQKALTFVRSVFKHDSHENAQGLTHDMVLFFERRSDFYNDHPDLENSHRTILEKIPQSVIDQIEHYNDHYKDRFFIDVIQKAESEQRDEMRPRLP